MAARYKKGDVVVIEGHGKGIVRSSRVQKDRFSGKRRLYEVSYKSRILWLFPGQIRKAK